MKESSNLGTARNHPEILPGDAAGSDHRDQIDRNRNCN